MTRPACARPLHPSDLPALEALMRRAGDDTLEHLLGFRPTGETWRRQTFDDPDYDPGLLWGIFRNQAPVACACGVRRPWKPGREETGFLKWIFVDPACRREGIGRHLLGMMEAEFQRRGVRTLVYGSAAPRYLLPGVPAGDAATLGLLRNAGWQTGKERVNLTLDPTEWSGRTALPTAAPPGIIRPVEQDDRHAFLDFVERTFSVSWAIECEPVFQSASEAFAVAWYAAPDAEPSGFAAVGATNPNWLGPMGVAPARRGRGIGKRLLLAALETAAEKGIRSLCIPWANEPFYTRCLGPLERTVFLKTEKKR